jgi:hypothetical protein
MKVMMASHISYIDLGDHSVKALKPVNSACFLLVSCVTQVSTPKVEAVNSFEASLNFSRDTRHYIPGNTALHYNPSNPTYQDILHKVRIFSGTCLYRGVLRNTQ